MSGTFGQIVNLGQTLQTFAGLEDVFKTFLEDVLKTLWRQTKCLLGMSGSNKSKCVSNKSIIHKYISDKSKANPNCIN